MKWTVEGADKKTGKDKVLQIEAHTKDEAERAASKMGLLVAKVRSQADLLNEVSDIIDEFDAVTPPVAMDYRTSVPAGRASAVPSYPGIVKGAELLKQTASTYRFLAWSIGVIAVLGAIAAIVGMVRTDLAILVGPGIGVMLACLPLSIMFLNWATMVDLTAELALAQRDIARNSFGK